MSRDLAQSERHRTRTVARWTVAVLLAIHAGLLAYSATQHSPTHLEPAFLASGISHWQFERYELYRVNPPLVRMFAALPVMAIGCDTDWSRFYDGPGSRSEFLVGEDFIKANGPASIPLFIYARWACIPFNLVGAYFAYRWANDLYQCIAAGFVTLILYVFEPNLLAHGELITPDGACTAFGIMAGYAFWCWLKRPTWTRALLAGGALGLAELTKMSWLILFGIWPLLWLIWRLMEPRKSEDGEFRADGQQEPDAQRSPSRASASHARLSTFHCQLFQLAAILALAVYIINLGYAFDGFGTRLKSFEFVSTALTGYDKPGAVGNRFRDTWLGDIPVPLPKQYVLGFDCQKKDFEDFGDKSYLRGEWKDGGWWYYYIYGLLVKVPCGTWGLLVLVIAFHFIDKQLRLIKRDVIVLILPAIALLILVSSQTEFNIHLRYVFPSLGMFLVLLGYSGHSFLTRRLGAVQWIAISLIGYSVISALRVYPHHLAYFNDFVGGPGNGHKHLLGSSVDWGQDILALSRWNVAHGNRYPLLIYSLYCPEYLLPEIRLPDIEAAFASGPSDQVSNTVYPAVWTRSIFRGEQSGIWVSGYMRQALGSLMLIDGSAASPRQGDSDIALPGFSALGPLRTDIYRDSRGPHLIHIEGHGFHSQN